MTTRLKLFSCSSLDIPFLDFYHQCAVFVIFVPKEQVGMCWHAPLPFFCLLSYVSWWLQSVFKDLCRFFHWKKKKKHFNLIWLPWDQKEILCVFFQSRVVFRWLLPGSISLVDFYLLFTLLLEMGRSVWLLCFSNRVAILLSPVYLSFLLLIICIK